MIKRICLLLLLIGIFSVAICQNQLDKHRFGVGVYDYYGHIRWQSLGPIPAASQEALKQMDEGDFTRAASLFRKVRKRTPLEPSAMAGLAECMRRLKKLPNLYNELGSEMQQADFERNPKPELAVFFRYVVSMLVHEKNLGNISDKFDRFDKATPGGWIDGFVRDKVEDWQKLSKPFWVMYLSTLVSLGDHEKARPTAKAMLASKPDFYQIRLLYALEMTGGVVATSKGKGGWIEAPPEIRGNMPEAFRQAQMTLEQVPNWAPAIYVTGVCAYYENDKKLAKDLLTRYVKEANSSDPYAESARRFLTKLK